MSRSRSKVANWAGRIAVWGAVASASASAAAFTVPGGTIYFKGALVAPPFSVAMQSGGYIAQSSIESDSAFGRAATVTFIAPPSSMPSADVALNASAAMKIGFVDGRGQRITRASTGAYHLGKSGGILSMQPARPDSAAAVTIVTTYN